MQHLSTAAGGRRLPKAGRDQVFAAADEILRSGSRPTIDAIKGLLGGGSPNSVVAYLNAWYSELGERLDRAETPAEGLAPEIHRAALLLQAAVARRAPDGTSEETTDALIRSLRAEVLSLQTLLEEVRGQRAQYIQRLADARALLLRMDEEQRELRAELLEVKSALAVAEDRLRRRPPRPAKPRTNGASINRTKVRKARDRPTRPIAISRAAASKKTPAAKSKRKAKPRTRK